MVISAVQSADPKQNVQKCCPIDERLYNSQCNKTDVTNEAYWSHYNVTFGMVNSKFDPLGNENETVQVLQSGVLQLINEGKVSDNFVDHFYCIDYNEDNQIVAIVGDKVYQAALNVTYAFLQVLGVVCLIATGVIYLMVTKLRNYHGKALACHTFHLALAMILNTAHSFYDEETTYLQNAANFAHLSSYAWLMVMWLNLMFLSKFPKRIKMGTFSFFFTFILVCAVCAMLIYFKIRQWLPPIDQFAGDKRGE